MRTELETSGDIRSVDLLAAFVGLWKRQASGTLSFSRAESIAGFEISEGQIVGASSSEPHFETGAILVRAGKLDPGAIARVVVAEGNDPAATALQAGILTRKDWNWGQKIRAIEILSDLLGWIEGRYEFDSEARPESGEFSLAIPRLLLELFLRSRDRSLVEHCLGPSDVPLLRAESFEGEFEELGLTAEAGTVVALIDGKASAEEIAEKAPAEEFAVLKLLAALTTLGLVHSADAAPDSSGKAGTTASPPTSDTPEAVARTEGTEETEETEEEEPEAALQAAGDAEPEGSQQEATLRQAAAEDRLEKPPSEQTLDLFPLSLPDASAPVPPRETSEELPVPENERSFVAEPSRRRGTGALAGGLLLLAAAVAALLLLRSREGGGGGGAQPPGPTPAPTRESLLFPPAETAPALPATRAPSISARPTIVPTRPASPTRPPTARPRASGSTPAPAVTPPPVVTERQALSAEEWARRAERDRSRLLSRRSTRYAVQLLLACELPTLTDAFRHDKEGKMWILPASYRGRNCFRILWGAYASRPEAIRGKASVPGFFLTGNNHPAVVAVR